VSQTELPYGSWPTPITSELVVASAVRVTDVRADGDVLVWAESRPVEGGRTQLVRRGADGSLAELLPADGNVRTSVHEYGGGAWWVREGIVWYADWGDQRLRRIDTSGVIEVLTPEPEVPRGLRYADGDVDPSGAWIACVRERHPLGGRGAIDVVNEIVRLSATAPSEPEVLVSGPDFVAGPRWSPDGARLCWIEWDHPRMPWDGTRLVVRDLATGEDTVVAGGDVESVTEPTWQPDGSLWFSSDRSGWYGLSRWEPTTGATTVVVDVEADVALPHWVFGTCRYVVLTHGRVVFARWRDGFDGLAVRLPDGSVEDLPFAFSAIPSLRPVGDDGFVLSAGTPTTEAAVHRITLGEGATIADDDVVKPARDLGLDAAWISQPEHITYPTAGGAVAHGLYYPPTNPDAVGPAGERPPLLVLIHGGPTAAARPELQIGTQYWTSRGFAVVDVNHRGSTGYGRAYRDLLQGRWGIIDVEDCVAAARFLAERGDADPDRLLIRGGSAGGFTTLAAMTFHNAFAAGASHFGVADLGVLAADTHKFESRYLDGLVGPWPEARATYEARSPIFHTEQLDAPLAVFQGLGDPVVPPNQSQMIVDAVRAKGVPVAYVTFEGEQHGFRQAKNIRAALDGELSFYAQVLGFALPPDEGIDPVEIIPPPA
jgi:dipeptidyl aminopeptidase/acylaminoacyl peptidase